MTNRKQTVLDRRNMLKLSSAGLVGTQFATAYDIAGAAEQPKLDLEDPTAKALAYVHDADKVDASIRGDASRNCANCWFYTEPNANWGPCNLFPGKAVSRSGWCKGWVATA